MKISNVYIGGWFQRTMLQLTEIYDFLRDCKSQLNLDPEKLQEFRKSLEIGKIDYGVAGEEYIEFTTALNMKVKVFDFEDEKDLESAINDFLDDTMEVIDIKYQVSMGIFSEEQIYCFSAMVVYYKK